MVLLLLWPATLQTPAARSVTRGASSTVNDIHGGRHHPHGTCNSPDTRRSSCAPIIGHHERSIQVVTVTHLWDRRWGQWAAATGQLPRFLHFPIVAPWRRPI